MAARENRMEERLQREDHFRRKALLIIIEMTDLCTQTPEDTSPLVDEILHSIFFLGGIHTPPISPESILRDDEDENLFDFLRFYFPRPFQLYFCKVPRRSPFSCVLDMMVKLVGQENEEGIKRRLQEFITDVERGAPSGHLISKAICVSQKSKDSVRHYGVSMSTSGCNARKIVIAASCLSAWDEYVAGAVMTYYPNTSINTYFNGTIQIPTGVKCQTFNLRNGGEMKPCRSCSDMFGLNTDETKEWPYGNCAEAESLSNLLKNETEVKEQTQRIPNMWTLENVNRAREDVLQKLRALLSRARFQWDVLFFTPQGI